MAIDSRLLDCDTQQEIEQNFNRTLSLISADSEAVGGNTTAISSLSGIVINPATVEGTYTLKSTVASDGSVSYLWELAV